MREPTALLVGGCVLLAGLRGAAGRPTDWPVPAARHASVAYRAADSSALLLVNVRVFDGVAGTFSVPTTVRIRDGRIVAVGDTGGPQRGERLIDAAGAFAIPPLWDSHVHLSFLTLGGDDSVQAVLARFVQAGVLYVRDVGGPLNVIQPLRDRVAARELVGPDIFFAGPLAERPPLYWARVNTALPGFSVPIETADDVDRLVAAVAGAGGDFVKAFGKWDRQLFRRLAAAARDSGLQVVVDPGLPFFQDLPVDTLLTLGVTSVEHAHAVWQSVLRTDLRVIHDSLAATPDASARAAFAQTTVLLGPASIDSARLQALGARWRRAGAYFCPTLRVAEQRRREPPPLPGVTSVADLRAFWGAYADANRRITAELAAQGVPMLVGQDGADPLATVEEMELLVAVGLPPVEVLRAATLYPARWLGRDSVVGSLSPGHRADLVLVRGDPLRAMEALRTPWMVIRSGVPWVVPDP